MSLEWKEEYSVQVKEIDDQHKQLLKVISELNDAISSMQTGEKMESILDRLIEYADIHFRTEEKYFDKFHYEGAEEHKKEHRKFTEKMKKIRKNLKDNEMKYSFELIDFLEDWLLQHLMNEDSKYVKCFKSHGLH